MAWSIGRRVMLGVLVGALLSTGACAKNRLAREQRREARTPVGEWRLVKIGDDPVDAIIPPESRPPALAIHPDGSVTGFTGVNQIRGLLDYHGFARGGFEMSDPVTTRMAGPPQMMAVEERFLNALAGRRSYRVEEGVLSIRGGKEPVLEFVRAQ